jgi:hypothetical protein
MEDAVSRFFLIVTVIHDANREKKSKTEFLFESRSVEFDLISHKNKTADGYGYRFVVQVRLDLLLYPTTISCIAVLPRTDGVFLLGNIFSPLKHRDRRYRVTSSRGSTRWGNLSSKFQKWS